MKKNKSFDNKIIKKQFIKLVISNMLAFILVYAILGAMLSTIIGRFFYNDLENELIICKRENEKTIGKVQGEYRVNVDNARIKVMLFDKDYNRLAYSRDLLNYVIPDYGLNQVVAPEIVTSYIDSAEIFKINDFEDEIIYHEQNKVEYTIYNFITLTFEVDSKFADEVKFCKLLIMNNGEIGIRNNILRIYMIVSSILVVLGMVASIILSKRAIKPISQNMHKQMQFVSDASHELRTPLAIVQSKLENILTKTNASVYDVSEDIAISLKEVSRLSKLTTDLLSLTRSDNGVSVINFDTYEIDEVLLDTILIFKEMAELEGKKLDYEIEEFSFLFDREKIIQLMVILLDNAIKYTSKNDSIEVKIIKEGSDCLINVSDTGIGINEETKKRIFERFYREDKARSRETGGNGLGLAIGKNIVMLHGGKITVSNNKPKGTSFDIRLPLKNKTIKNNFFGGV